jgi:hypothetical protein
LNSGKDIFGGLMVPFGIRPSEICFSKGRPARLLDLLDQPALPEDEPQAGKSAPEPWSWGEGSFEN